MRLKEVEQDGIIEQVENGTTPTAVRLTLTEKGRDTLPILMRFIAFGSKWYADEDFEDKTPRSIQQIFTRPQSQGLIQRLYSN